MVPFCKGLGHWVFDNSTRSCDYTCEVIESEEEEEEMVECGIGGQDERNACCSSQNVGTYQGCLGSWVYNNAAQACSFACNDLDDPVDPPEGGNGGSTSAFGDPVSDFCFTIQDSPSRDLCCNDALKNPLSSGPRSGFPDCIGTYYFNEKIGCEFECADHVEMMEILDEIKQRIPSQN